MRSDDEIYRCARADRLTQISSRVTTGSRASRAGPRSSYLRNRSDTERARGRHRWDAKNSDTKSYFVGGTDGPKPWKDARSNNTIYRTAFRNQNKIVHCYGNPK